MGRRSSTGSVASRRISTARQIFARCCRCASWRLPRKAISTAIPALPQASAAAHWLRRSSLGARRRRPRHRPARRSRRLDQHRQPLDPRRPADRRRVRAAERFDQPVIAPAAKHRALRAEPVGDEFERGVAVIIEPAHQPRRCASRRRPPRRARRSPPRRSPPPRAVRKSSIPGALSAIGRSRGSLLNRGCAADSCRAASRLSSRQLAAMRREMLDQRRAPRLAASRHRPAC